MLPRFRATLLAALMVALVVAPATAQDWRFDIGINGGGSWYSSMLDEEHLLVDDTEVRFEPGWLAGAQATAWLHPIVGLRANGTYSERPLEAEIDDNAGFTGGLVDGVNLIEDVNLWSGTGDLMIRFLGPNEQRFIGVEWLPYLALGAGAKWIDPAGETTLFVEEEDDGDIEERDGTFFNLGGQNFALLEDTKFMGLVGLGSDVRIAERLSIRAEVGDRIYDSPIVALDDDLLPIEAEEDVGNVVHEVYGQIGLHYLMGLRQPERVAAAPAPPPPAAPAPPAEERITMCIVDPAVSGHLGEVEAIYRPETGDTLVTLNGVEYEIGELEGRTVVARDVRWFETGEPLTLEYDGLESEFVTFGGARLIEPGDLVFLGTVDGLPVYADEDEVQDIREELDELRGADDLEDRLEQRDDLREDFEDIEVLYVPLDVTGCTFQPVQRVEDVRKIRN